MEHLDAVTQSQYELLVASLSDCAVFLTDSCGVVTTWNSGAEAVTGYAKADIVGINFSAFYQLQEVVPLAKPAAHLEIAAREGRFEEQGWRLRKDGSRFWARVVITPTPAQDGRPAGFAMLTRDLTATKGAEVIAAAEHQLRIAQQISHVGSWSMDAATQVISWSDEMHRILGTDPALPPPAFPAQQGMFAAASWDRLVQTVELCLEKGGTYAIELEMLRPDGERRWGVARGAARKSEDGRVVELSGTLQDVTERKRQQAELDHMTRRLAIATEGAGVGIWEWVIATDRLIWDDQMFRLYGSVRTDFSVPYDTWERALFPADLVRATSELQAAVDGQDPFNTTFRISMPDGSVRYIRAHGIVERDPDGHPLRVLGTNWDVTKENEAKLALVLRTSQDIAAQKAAADAAQESLHEKEVLLKEVHHRVKNNLQVIGSMINLQLDRTSNADVQSILSELKGRIHAIALLHERIYRAADLRRIDLAEYLSGLVGEAARAAGPGGASTRVAIEQIHIGIDTAVPVGLIVNELVTNAFKHGLKHRPSGGRVSLEGFSNKGRVELLVADNGVGFPEDYRAEDSRSLGMFLIGALTKQVRGTITFARRDGETRCTLSFPLREEPSPR